MLDFSDLQIINTGFKHLKSYTVIITAKKSSRYKNRHHPLQYTSLSIQLETAHYHRPMDSKYFNYSKHILVRIFDYLLAFVCLIIVVAMIVYLANANYGSIIYILSIPLSLTLILTAIMLIRNAPLPFNLNSHIRITNQIIAFMFIPISVYFFVVEIITTSSFLDGIGFFFSFIFFFPGIILWVTSKRIQTKTQ